MGKWLRLQNVKKNMEAEIVAVGREKELDVLGELNYHSMITKE